MLRQPVKQGILCRCPLLPAAARCAQQQQSGGPSHCIAVALV